MRGMMWLITLLSLFVEYAQGMLDPTQKIPWSESFRTGQVKRGSKRDSVLFTLESGQSEEVPIATVQQTLNLLQTPPSVEDDTGTVLHELLQNRGLARFLKLEHIEQMAQFDPATFNYDTELSLLEEKYKKGDISRQVYKLECETLKVAKRTQQDLQEQAKKNSSGRTATQMWQDIVDKRRQVTQSYIGAWKAGDREKIVSTAEKLHRRHKKDCDLCHLCDECLTKCLIS